MKNYKRDDYNQLISLYLSQRWLHARQNALHDLLEISKKHSCPDLIYSLLQRFNFIDDNYYQLLLDEIADYLIDNISDFKNTQLVALAYDSDTDSSQRILYDLANTLGLKNIRNFKTSNQFGKSISLYKKGYTNLVIVDEFIGSGRTLNSRNEWITKNLKLQDSPQYIFLAGIKSSIEKFKDLNIFCPLQMDRGISEFYIDEQLTLQTKNMIDLESYLQNEINGKKIEDYSFGYGKAEALYTLEGCRGNTPNNVFPIFWWPKDSDNRNRMKLLNRRENGF